MLPERICCYKRIIDPNHMYLEGDQMFIITREDRRVVSLGRISAILKKGFRVLDWKNLIQANQFPGK